MLLLSSLKNSGYLRFFSHSRCHCKWKIVKEEIFVHMKSFICQNFITRLYLIIKHAIFLHKLICFAYFTCITYKSDITRGWNCYWQIWRPYASCSYNMWQVFHCLSFDCSILTSLFNCFMPYLIYSSNFIFCWILMSVQETGLSVLFNTKCSLRLGVTGKSLIFCNQRAYQGFFVLVTGTCFFCIFIKPVLIVSSTWIISFVYILGLISPSRTFFSGKSFANHRGH